MAESANLIAEIESKGEKKKGDNVAIVVSLKEANGKTWEWTSWHKTVLNDYNVGDVIEIVPDLKENPNGKYPFRNIKQVIGKREKSQINTLDVMSGQATGLAQTGRSGNGMSDYVKAIERRSIERQTSVKLMAEIYKAGCGVDDLQIVAEAIVKAAETVETWLARQGPPATVKVPDPDNYGKFIDAPVNGVSFQGKVAKEEGQIKMETIGDLFTACQRKYKKKPQDIFDTLDVESKEELLEKMKVQTAWDTLESLWKGPPFEATPTN